MRYSLFAGLPLSLVVVTAAWELCQRFVGMTVANAAVLLSLLALFVVLHKLDELRFYQLLNPSALVYPVRAEAACEQLLQTLRQIQFEAEDGVRSSWQLLPGDAPVCEIDGRIAVRCKVSALNIVGWLLDYLDQSHCPRTVLMHIKLTDKADGTHVAVCYELEPMLDWSRCGEIIKQTNAWIDESLGRFRFELNGELS